MCVVVEAENTFKVVGCLCSPSEVLEINTTSSTYDNIGMAIHTCLAGFQTTKFVHGPKRVADCGHSCFTLIVPLTIAPLLT